MCLEIQVWAFVRAVVANEVRRESLFADGGGFKMIDISRNQQTTRATNISHITSIV